MKFNKGVAESEYLFLKHSQLPNSGIGLFTKVFIAKGKLIAEYVGERITHTEANKRAAEHKDQYFVDMGDGTILDPMNTECFAKYANDAVGLVKSHFKNNALIQLNGEGGVGLYALRNIKAGEEIFCAYGDEYWDNVKARL